MVPRKNRVGSYEYMIFPPARRSVQGSIINLAASRNYVRDARGIGVRLWGFNKGVQLTAPAQGEWWERFYE